jgi:hypothetical protein
MAATDTTIRNLPPKTRPKTGWYEGNEKTLDKLIATRNAATRNHAKRKTKSSHDRLKEARTKLKKAKKQCKMAWWLTQLANVNASVNPGPRDHKHPGSIWKTAARIKKGTRRWRPRDFKNVRDAAGNLAKAPEDNARYFADYFTHVFNPKIDAAGWEVIDKMNQRECKGKWGEPTKEELKTAIATLKDTAAGPTGLPACVWKTLGKFDNTFQIILDVMQECWRTKTTPAAWKKTHMAVLPKKGDLTLCKNYRAIMVGDLEGKLFQIILNNRLQLTYEDIAPEHSNGFRPGRGTSDSLFIFLQTLRKRKEHQRDSWVLLLDAVKAFDRVPRQYLWAVMLKMGVDQHTIEVLQNLYEGTTATMLVEWFLGCFRACV